MTNKHDLVAIELSIHYAVINPVESETRQSELLGF